MLLDISSIHQSCAKFTNYDKLKLVIIMKLKKTNAMRILDQHQSSYIMHTYDKSMIEKGIDVATQIGEDARKIYKTIVLHHETDYFVAVIPINEHIDMKKVAKVVGVKNVSLLHLNDLLKITGYVRGGCSPIGMKKVFPTVFDSSIDSMDTIIVSAGKIGFQMEVNPNDLVKILNASISSVLMNGNTLSE